MILRFRTLFGFLALLSLFSCGGGSSISRDDTAAVGSTGSGTVAVTRSIALAFNGANGQPSISLSESTPLTLTATATDSNGDPVTSTLITYRFQPEGLAVFGNDAGTASTDANGVATIQILVGANSGAGEIVATLSSGEEATTTFNSTGNSGGSRSIQLALTDQLNGEVSAELSPTSPLRLTAIVSDSNGGPVTGSVISYTFEPEGLAVFGNDSATARTGTDGEAIIDILVGENSGAGQITATLSSGETAIATFNSAGNSGGGGSRSIQLLLTDQLNGEASAELSPTSPLRLTAIVSNSNGQPVTSTLITYTFQPDGLAIFGNDSGTASTDANGVAIIEILAGENSGAGQITATLSSGETAITTFNSAGNGVSRSIQLALTDQLNGEASAELSLTSPLRLTAIVSNSSGEPVTSTLITYTFQPDGLAIFGNDSGTASTDANGVATIEILVGENSGAGQITATLSSGETAITTFNSEGNGGSRSIQLALTDQSNGEASAELSPTSPLTLTAIVSNSNGEPVTSTLIAYTFQPDGLAIFGNDSGTASTDANGVAIIEILVGENSGAGQILATLSSGETATTTFNSAGTTLVGEQPASLDLFGSSTQLASSGSDEIELIALVKDVNNVLLEGIDVTFSVNSEATIQLENSGNVAVTGADGIARAFLNTQNKPENRTITVTATASGLADPKTLDVIVVGTGISVNTPPSVILGSEAELTIFLSDSDGKGIANKTVQINSENGNLFYNFDSPPKLVTELVTDGEGQATVTYSANNSGIDVITATGLNAEGVPVNISVQQDQFSFNIVTSDDINLGELSTLGLTWLKENSPLSNGAITLTTTRGTLNTSSVTTDADGKASFQISSANAGRAVVSAQGKDINGNIVNARADVEFIAINVDNIILSASPNSIGPSGQKSTVTAVLRDAAGNLVKGKTVNFNADDVSGGEISPASAVTDSNGLASTVYTSLNVTKENGITIIAKEPDSGVDAVVNLTVANRAQFISIGTGNLIESPDETSYLKKFTVFVTDANSNPVSNVELTVTGTPVKYTELLEPNAEDGDPNYQVIRPAFYKGFWSAFPSIEDFEYWVAVRTIGCANEDVDSDGIEDPNENTNGDDGLTPVNIVSIDGNVVTDENGQAIIELRYAKTYAAWGEIKITASTPVSGSESQASQFFTLSASAADLSLDTTPPNNNPFGTGVNRVEDANNPGTFTDDGANLTCSNAL